MSVRTKLNCHCMSKMNERLQQDYPGVYLREMTNLGNGEVSAVIAAQRRVGKGKTPPIVALFCPFCGQKYNKEPAAQPKLRA